MKENIAEDFINNLEKVFDTSEKGSEAREATKLLAIEGFKGVVMQFLENAADNMNLNIVPYETSFKFHTYDNVEPVNLELDRQGILDLKKYL